MTIRTAGERDQEDPSSPGPAGGGTNGAASSEPETWELRLYVAGQTRKSLAALANLRRLCEELPSRRYSVEVVDLLEQPQRARIDQIVAIPTLVRALPSPMRKIIGDLSNTDRVRLGLDLRPQ